MTFGVRMAPEGRPGRWSRPRRRKLFRRGTGTLYRKLQSVKFLLTRDRAAVAAFLTAPFPFDFPLARRLDLIHRYLHITHQVRGYHTLAEMLTVTSAILSRDEPLVVECGSGSGSSTAKLSLATRMVGGELLVFDSFQGIPENDELHHLIDGRPLTFRRGAFRGRLTAVKKRVEAYGAPEVCRYHKGLFEETLPGFARRADVVLLDVDLLSSTRTCVTHLFPQLNAQGVLFSQDGHIRETTELLTDEAFWRSLSLPPPVLETAAGSKLLRLRHRQV